MSVVSTVLNRLKPTPWAELDTFHKVRRVVGYVAQVGALGMAVSASTSESEVGLRADGSLAKEHRDEIDEVKGDPKNKAQRDQAGEQKKAPDTAASDTSASNTAAPGTDDVEAQGGNAADDTEKAAESSA